MLPGTAPIGMHSSIKFVPKAYKPLFSRTLVEMQRLNSRPLVNSRCNDRFFISPHDRRYFGAIFSRYQHHKQRTYKQTSYWDDLKSLADRTFFHTQGSKKRNFAAVGAVIAAALFGTSDKDKEHEAVKLVDEEQGEEEEEEDDDEEEREITDDMLSDSKMYATGLRGLPMAVRVLLFGSLVGMFLGYTFLIGPFITTSRAKFGGIPFYVTSLKRMETAFNLLPHQLENKKFVDLGSGDGRMCIYAAHKGMHATGYELNGLLQKYSTFTADRSGVGDKATFVKKNFWEVDLSPFDVVYIAGAKGVMEKLSEKLLKELRPGSYVISPLHKLPNWKPVNMKDDVFLFQKLDHLIKNPNEAGHTAQQPRRPGYPGPQIPKQKPTPGP